jgi:hypothetical protein
MFEKKLRRIQLNFETPSCQDMSFEAEELKLGLETSELLSAVEWV